jgi:GNAT superfamily N-acetyltransferase
LVVFPRFKMRTAVGTGSRAGYPSRKIRFSSKDACVKIAFLADAMEVLPEIARAFSSGWPDEPVPGAPAAGRDWESDFRGCARRGEMPLNLVALAEGRPIGTVFLLQSVPRADPALGPWIEGLFVIPSRRHAGVAMALVSAALGVAWSLGRPRVLIAIRAAREVYEARGWRVEQVTTDPARPLIVLSHATAAADVGPTGAA